MDVSEARYDNVVVMTVSGRLDQDSSLTFQMQLLATLAPEDGSAVNVVLDFGGVEYISSVGLRAVMIGAKESKSAGGSLSVANLVPLVKEVFEISRFHHVIAIHEETRDAVAALSEQALTAFDER